MRLIKVAANSPTAAVAGAIAGICREDGHAEVQAIGAGAVNQAIKGITVAKGFLEEEGREVFFVPSFVDVSINTQQRTAVKVLVETKMCPSLHVNGE